MKKKNRGSFIVVIVYLSLLFAGCAWKGPAGSITQKGLMDFLENGRTTREMILETLGRPASPFENGRVHTYQIGRREGTGYFVFESPAQAAKDHSLYNLVLIFDEKGILMKHALLRVR